MFIYSKVYKDVFFHIHLHGYVGMDQYLLIPFLGGWTSIYQFFWCSPGVIKSCREKICAWAELLWAQELALQTGRWEGLCTPGFAPFGRGWKTTMILKNCQVEIKAKQFISSVQLSFNYHSTSFNIFQHLSTSFNIFQLSFNMFKLSFNIFQVSFNIFQLWFNIIQHLSTCLSYLSTSLNDHSTSFNIFEHHSTSFNIFNIIPHLSTSFNIIQHRSTFFNYHSTSFNIKFNIFQTWFNIFNIFQHFQHLSIPFNIFQHLATPGCWRLPCAELDGPR